MVTLGEFVRWILYSVRDLYTRIAARLLRRDKLLVRSEDRFRALLESAPDAMVIVNWHGHIELVNAQTEKLFGYARSELIGQNVTELIPERARPDHREHQKDYMREARTRPMGTGLDLFGLRKDGSEFPVEISLSPLDTDRGMLVSAVIRDITDRKLIEAQLRDRAAALERSNADLERFAYVASHDLRAPLRVISGFVELLDRRYSEQLAGDGREFIQMTVSGVQRMERLIDDLLAFSRVRLAEDRFVSVDCGESVRDVITTLAGTIESKQAQVTVSALPTVRGEPSQITQLFQNLVDNAVKFSNSETPVVDISATHADEMWRFEVRDNGIGIDPENRERVFQMFQRLHTDDEFPGTGIGLAICKRIVEHHGGTLDAEAAPGGGTIMVFTLPEWAGEADAGATAAGGNGR